MRNNVWTIIIMCVLILCMFMGCGQRVKGYTSFSIDEYDEFFDLVSDSDRENYIRKGNLDFSKIQDVILVPFVKETTHTECAIFLYGYSLNVNRTVQVNYVMLTAPNGAVICEDIPTEQEMSWEPATDSMTKGILWLQTFEKDSSWFYNDSKLHLSIELVVEGEPKVMSYEISLIGHTSVLLPT